jgi:hypothetical protein
VGIHQEHLELYIDRDFDELLLQMTYAAEQYVGWTIANQHKDQVMFEAQDWEGLFTAMDAEHERFDQASQTDERRWYD